MLQILQTTFQFWMKYLLRRLKIIIYRSSKSWTNDFQRYRRFSAAEKLRSWIQIQKNAVSWSRFWLGFKREVTVLYFRIHRKEIEHDISDLTTFLRTSNIWNFHNQTDQRCLLYVQTLLGKAIHLRDRLSGAVYIMFL